MTADVTDGRPALREIRMDRRGVDRLAAQGLISAAARDFALEAIEPPRRWGLWASRLVTVVGASLMLSGIVYFFAFNWNQIPPMAKLGAIAALIAGAVLTVVIVGFGRLTSDVAGSAAVLLVGVFLAVDGQIHQTGADAWQLFAGWAGLTFVLALLGGSAATWTVWLAVADLAVITWWQQTQPRGDRAGLYLAVMALDAAFLVARESLVAAGHDWPAARWTRVVLAVPILTAATFATFWLIDFKARDLDALDWATVAAVPLVLAGFFVVYRRRLPDLAVLSATAITACVIVDVVLYRLLAGRGSQADFGLFLLMGLVTLAIFAGAVAWLRGVARSMEASR